MNDHDEWDPVLERIRSLRFPPDDVLDPFLARRLDAILDRRRRPTNLLLALIAEHTGTTVKWLLHGDQEDTASGLYRVLVTISRGYPANTVRHHLDRCLDYTEHLGLTMVMVHGDYASSCDQPDSDEIADLWGTHMMQAGRPLTIERHPAQNHPTQNFGPWPGCGPARNKYMVGLGGYDLCMAFIGPCASPRCRRTGKHPSHGALGCAELADQAGIPVRRWIV